MRDLSPTLILASGSPYRRALLERLGLPFQVRPANADETIAAGEAPGAAALRLARAKAAAIEPESPSLVIGSDQVAEIDGRILGKPGGHEQAARQLREQSGRLVLFHTALCLRDTRDGGERTALDTVRVRFRELTDAEIEAYLHHDRPYDCAGSFKSELLGSALCESIESDDPASLVGLPLIRLAAMLREAGVRVP